MAKVRVGRDESGAAITAESVDFTPEREEWNVYHLADGNTIRLRTIVLNILKTDKVTDTGEPVYVVKSSTIVDVRTGTEKK